MRGLVAVGDEGQAEEFDGQAGEDEGQARGGCGEEGEGGEGDGGSGDEKDEAHEAHCAVSPEGMVVRGQFIGNRDCGKARNREL